MIDFFTNLNPYLFTLFAGFFTWGVTAFGAGCVFFFKRVSQLLMDSMMGIAGGIMLAAAFFSLILPSIELSYELGYPKWLFSGLGIFFGGLFVVVASLFLEKRTANTLAHTKKRSILLVTSVTLHNIPEGLCVGVAIGAFMNHVPSSELMGILLLILGIGLQNFPEGAAVSLPLRRDGYSRKKAFFMGQASGSIELASALIGCLLSSLIRIILPFALAFSAGAMLSVVGAELMPESTNKNKHPATVGLVIGFVVMMFLDIFFA